MMNNHTPAKLAYAPPSIMVYGAFNKLTAAGSNTGMEGSGVGNRARRA
jgi:hypothetical protein